MELKRMSDKQLAKRIVDYVERIDELERAISQYIHANNRPDELITYIRYEYRQLKEELREDAHYVDLLKNREGSTLYMAEFSGSISEASAWGFREPINARINQQFYSAVADARYKLTKYFSLARWKEIANG